MVVQGKKEKEEKQINNTKLPKEENITKQALSPRICRFTTFKTWAYAYRPRINTKNTCPFLGEEFPVKKNIITKKN